MSSEYGSMNEYKSPNNQSDIKQRFHSLLTHKKPKKRQYPHQQRKCFNLLDRQTYEILVAFISFNVELFRVVMACLFTLFVPQLCPSEKDKTCSPIQDLTSLSPLGYAAVIVNFLTLGVAIGHYWVVFRRERMFIAYLDADDEVGEFILPKVLTNYPDINSALYSINNWLLISSIISSFFFIANVVVSGIYLFKDRYLDTQTATVFLTNLGLITSVLQTTIDHAYIGMKHKLALSCIEFSAQSYNVIDDGYVNPDDPSRGGRDEDKLEQLVQQYKRSEMVMPSV